MKKEYNFKKMKVAHRGPVADPKEAKITKTIKLDLDIVSWLLQESDRRRIPYQTMINALLKEAMDRSQRGQDENIRQIVREEIAKMKTA